MARQKYIRSSGLLEKAEERDEAVKRIGANMDGQMRRDKARLLQEIKKIRCEG
jgi:hypothetical protein